MECLGPCIESVWRYTVIGQECSTLPRAHLNQTTTKQYQVLNEVLNRCTRNKSQIKSSTFFFLYNSTRN